ncbi:MAG: hypothetical protein FJX52_07350 [Alphaproteobacteria bacterium]|nr:hypothetical protein [Alphaproteobacteria bacterium]
MIDRAASAAGSTEHLSVFAAAEAGELLAWARRKQKQIARLPAQVTPSHMADAYAVQAHMARRLGHDIDGWKIGCTSPEAQKLLGANGPFAGPLFRPFIHSSPADLSAKDFHRRGLEPEFAFTLARDLPPRGRDYGRDEVAAAVASLHPAIEIVDSRFTTGFGAGVLNLIADDGVNGAFVHGPAVTQWQPLDLAAWPVELKVDGKVVKAGVGANVMGHPLNALVWLANLLAGPTSPAAGANYGGLRAGQIVTTGTCAGIFDAGPSDRAIARFGKLGETRVQFHA